MALITSLILYLIAVVAVISMWRGLWGLMDEYIWPKNPRRSYLFTFIVGFIAIVAVLFLL